jgi:hypothetical protein
MSIEATPEQTSPTGPTPAELAAEAARLEQDMREVLFIRCVNAVSDGIARESGPNIRPEVFEQFGAETAAGCYLFLSEAHTTVPENLQGVYVEAFLAATAATIGKVGIRQSRGRVVPAASAAAEATVKMAGAAREAISRAEETVLNQVRLIQHAQQNRLVRPLPGTPQTPAVGRVGDNTQALLRALDGNG